MKKKIVFCFICVSILCISALAHPGKTDSNGGHTNRGSGEYHYHHGYPAHNHIDDSCPYDFDDKTNHDSDASSNDNTKNSSTRQTLVICLVIFSPLVLLFFGWVIIPPIIYVKNKLSEARKKHRDQQMSQSKQLNKKATYIASHHITSTNLFTLCIGYAVAIILCFFNLPWGMAWLYTIYPILSLAVAYGFKSKTNDADWIATKVCSPCMLIVALGCIFGQMDSFVLFEWVILKGFAFAITTSIVILERNITKYFEFDPF